MEYIPEKNQLVLAIRKMNWEAVISVLQTEPQLVNTYDQFHQTPLMLVLVFWWSVQDNDLEMMIDAATKKNIEHEDEERRTILHYLARRGRVSALRRALQKSNIKVNGGDFDGRTPLHECLDNENRCYEEHRETAICLMEQGALLIKDNKGKTPLDLYDKNKCFKYGGRSIRREKKEELKKLLLAMTLPAQIKARGKDAVTAFANEIEKGEITLVNSRVMFLGKEGAGKTSLVNSIFGKQFNKNEPSTDGIVTTTVFQTGEDCSKWEEHKDVDVSELTKQIREYNIAEHIARKLEPPESQETTSMSVSPSSAASPMVTSEEARSLTSEERETSDVFQSAANVSTRQFDRLPEEIVKKVVAKLDYHNPKRGHFKRFFKKITRKKTTDKIPSDVTCMWDYAGQISYYITHRFFLTDGSSYVVVFSLFDPLNELAKSRGPLKDQFEMTNLQMIIFWIRSIYEHAVLQYNASTKLINDTIASPTISLVGTHKDKLEGSEEDKQNQIEAIFKIIFEVIKGMPFEVHVDRTMYAVDNTSANDKGIEELKKNLGGYTKQMAKTVPTKWVDFQSKIQEVGKTTLRMSLDEVTKIAVDCGIQNENTIHILNYSNDCGIIMYSPTNIKLKNTVITNVHMLIEIFTKVITTEDKRPAMMKLWHLLDKGILSETLLRHLWKHELEEDASSFDIFVELMKVFGLLFEKQTLEITHRIVVDANDKQVISEPHPSVCMEVLNYLKHQLKTVYGTTEGIGYKLRVLCSVCQPTQQPHLHDLEDCLKKDKVSCGKMSMQTFRFKRLFSTEFVEEIKNFQ
ncbi:uncharacterized protein LOC117101475, partial [Anneissia japonica]|uniref:uncharacterized protein LOC117101475 n=1 Tax=Anneissia japonica TaxID=1529436 RepID=UPI001425AA8A